MPTGEGCLGNCIGGIIRMDIMARRRYLTIRCSTIFSMKRPGVVGLTWKLALNKQIALFKEQVSPCGTAQPVLMRRVFDKSAARVPAACAHIGQALRRLLDRDSDDDLD